jgi:hypothetical protein
MRLKTDDIWPEVLHPPWFFTDKKCVLVNQDYIHSRLAICEYYFKNILTFFSSLYKDHVPRKTSQGAFEKNPTTLQFKSYIINNV